MSRRFGRNQKRKLRAELSDVLARCREAERRRALAQHREHIALDAMETFRARLGEHCHLFDPKVKPLKVPLAVFEDAERLRVIIGPGLGALDIGSGSPIEYLPNYVAELKTAVWEVDLDKLRSSITCFLQLSDGRTAYSFTDSAALHMGAERLAHEIVKRTEPYLLEQLLAKGVRP